MSENKNNPTNWIPIVVIALLVFVWYPKNKDSQSIKKTNATDEQSPTSNAPTSATKMQLEPAQNLATNNWTSKDEESVQTTTHPEVNERSAVDSDESSSGEAYQSDRLAASLPPQQIFVDRPKTITPSLSSEVYIGEGSGHWINENHNGEIIELEDGSQWQVAPGDEIDAALWLPVSNITVIASTYGYTLVNTDDKEQVSASLIRIHQ